MNKLLQSCIEVELLCPKRYRPRRTAIDQEVMARFLKSRDILETDIEFMESEDKGMLLCKGDDGNRWMFITLVKFTINRHIVVEDDNPVGEYRLQKVDY